MRRRLTTSLAAACALAAAAPASGTPTVLVTPATAVVEPGEAFTMDIRVDAGTDTVTCFLVEFEFDPDVIELVSAEEGSLFSECGFPTMYNWDVLDIGHHSCNDVTLGPYTYTVAPGELVDLEFVAGEAGSTPIEILAVDLRDYRRDRILPVWTADGMVIIAGSGVADGEPACVALSAFPNPFTDAVEIELSSPAGGDVPGGPERALPRGAPAATTYDLAGRLVATLPPPRFEEGWTVRWNGRDGAGARCAAGVYLVEFRWESTVFRKAVVLVD